MNDLVSVIIPTYNRASTCKKAVMSVLAQTHVNVEAVVVDDASTDETPDVFQEMDSRVRYFRQKSNGGVSAARNRGLKEAAGDFIAFLDSDDEWLPWKLETQLKVLEAFPEAGMVWTDFRAIAEDGALVKESYLKTMYDAYNDFDSETGFRSHTRLSEIWKDCPDDFLDVKCHVGYIFSWMMLGNLVHTSTVLMRRERQQQVGLFDVDLVQSGEDYDFHFRTCRMGDVAFLDVPSINYRVGASDQLTTQQYMIWIARNNLKTVSKMLSVAREEIVLPPGMIRKRLAESFAWLGQEELALGNRSARTYLKESLRLSPFQRRTATYYLLSCLSPALYTFLRQLR